MDLRSRYELRRAALLKDRKVCPANRRLFREFLDWEEYKLKRINGLPSIDERSAKTMLLYIIRLRNVNAWFANKPWRSLTKKDIQSVYDRLEDGRIKNHSGKPFGDRKGYYDKIFRSKPFKLAGKVDLAKEVLEFAGRSEDKEVRFIDEVVFKKIVSATRMAEQRALLWLAFDIGENVDTLLALQKKDLVRQLNPTTKGPEFRVNLAPEKLKRTRRSRSEITNHPETADFLDMLLQDKLDDDKLFGFEYRQALKFITLSVRKAGARCQPKGQWVTWKDLRSSMACDLLKKGWTTDEIKARLGHKPSSRVLDKYVNYLAIGRHEAKKKLNDADIRTLREELEGSRGREKLLAMRMDKLQNEFETERREARDLFERLRPANTLLEELMSEPAFKEMVRARVSARRNPRKNRIREAT